MDASGTTTYGWDFENRLTSVVLPAGGGTVSFVYDPFGRRIKKAKVSTTIYVYDGADILEEVNSTGSTVNARYTMGPGIDQPLAEKRGTVTSFYEADGLGTITSITTAAGAIGNTYTYGSYGKLNASSGTIVNTLRYTARELDSETNLYYYRARYYDQNVGRFLSEDPARHKESLNFYEYVSNNPTSFFDPSGKKKCGCNVRIKCHEVAEFTLGTHCWFVVKDADAGYRRLSAHAKSGIDGPLVTENQPVDPNAPDPGSWTTNLESDYDCKKTDCLVDYTKVFGARCKIRTNCFCSTARHLWR